MKLHMIVSMAFKVNFCMLYIYWLIGWNSYKHGWVDRLLLLLLCTLVDRIMTMEENWLDLFICTCTLLTQSNQKPNL